MVDIKKIHKAFQLLTDDEKRLYTSLNKRTTTYKENKTIPEVFNEVANCYAERIAVTFEGGQKTYRELHQESNKIAHMLRAYGLAKGDFVAVVMERSYEALVSLLGIMKAGGVYVPIDPTYPKERCQYLLDDTAAPFILTKVKHHELMAELLKGADSRTVFYTEKIEQGYPAEDVPSMVSPSDLAYVIYTSGSTGKPKGTMLKHSSVINLIEENRRIYNASEEDVFSQFISFSFDPSIGEIFTALFSGARLHMLTKEQRISIDAFADMVEKEKITAATLPNAFFNQLATYLPAERKDSLKSLKSISVGGEALLGTVVRLWQQKFGTNTNIINVYGPTECTVLSSYYKVSAAVPDSVVNIPIGKPIANYEMYIVNDKGQLCPINEPGELYIAGLGLAAGYLNRPEKTAEAFVSHLFSEDANERMYRTGDLVRLLPSGDIEFVGRKDTQIKVRGFRIELGEVESAMAGHSQVQHAVVLAKKMADGNNSLFGYYTTLSNVALSEDDMRAFLTENLPGYMVPERFMQLDEMPLAPTGKIDRKKLAELKFAPVANSNYIAPQNDMQQLLANTWQEALGLERVGIRDNFFHIGGHSLKILEILVQVKKHTPFLTIQDFFKYQTIEELDAYIKTYEHEDEKVETTEFSWKHLKEPKALAEHENIPSLPMNTVLLTGATGFLGSHVLYELLHKTEAHIYCLIRSSANTSLKEKLSATLRFYFDDKTITLAMNRITIVEGDLGKPNLALSEEVRAMLVQNIDAIIHCGADVRHFGAAEHFQNVNIEGTKCLLALAKAKQGVHFHHVSTIGIPEELAARDWDFYEQYGDFNYDVTLESVYNQSKLEAEKIVRAAVTEGIPTTVYRVGNLTCHSESGKFQQNMDNNAFYRMIKSMLCLGKTPSANWYIDFTPINFASAALVAIASQPKSSGHVFHLCNPNSLLYADFVKLLRDMGYELDVVKAKEYEAWLLSDDHTPNMKEYLSLAIAQLDGDGAADTPFIFDSTNTQSFLQNTNVFCAVPDKAYIRKLIDYGISMNYFPEPRLVGVN